MADEDSKTHDLPDPTLKRLREAVDEANRARQRKEDLVRTACELLGLDPQRAQIDLQAGVVVERDASGTT